MGHSQHLLGLFLIVGFALGGCNPDARGFKLPPGDPGAGRVAFVELGCNECHRVADIELVAAAETGFNLKLGGTTTKVRTYGELLTSIINPSHKIARRFSEKPLDTDGESAMRTYNSFMTVQQLVDLVTFLESQYELEMPQSYVYL